MSASARLALLWSFAERYAGLLVAIASTMILSRLLTPAQVGVYSLCAAFTAVAGILRDFGISEYLIQERDLTREKLRAAYGIAILIAWSIGSLIFSTRHAVADFYKEPKIAEVLMVLTIHFFILPISSPTFALLNREMAFRQIFFLQLASNFSQALVSVSLAYAGFGVMSLAWGPVVNVAVQTLILMFIRPAESLVIPSLKNAQFILRFGSMYVLSRSVETLARNAHDPVIAKQFDFASVGLYSRAFGLIEMFHANIGAAVIRVATPAFAARYRAGQSMSEPYVRATAIFACVSWTFFGFVALMAEPIIHVMFGAQWLPAAPLAVALALATLPQGLFALAPQMLSATGHVGRRLWVSLIYSPVHVVLVLLAAQVSLLAVACVWFASNSLMLGMYLWHLRKVLNMKLSLLLGPSLRSAGVAGASVAIQAVCMRMLQQWGASDLVLIAAVLVAGVLAWIAAASLFSHPVYAEILNGLGALRARLKRQSKP